jgi:hypothetical protein
MAEVEEQEALEQTLTENEQVIEVFDFEGKSYEELLKILKKASLDGISLIEQKIAAVKDVFFERYNHVKSVALQAFVDEGGLKDDFEFRDSSDILEIKSLLNKLSDQVKSHYLDKKEQIVHNLNKKKVLLSQLRDLVNSDENKNTFKEVKAIQEEWKSIGDIPSNKMREVYPNYKALLDIFYNNRSIYYELKDLDRRKNLEVKTKICEDAENLLAISSAREMIVKLKELHAKYKHTGPIPKEFQDQLWERLKVASQKVYDYKDEVNATFVVQLNKNLDSKKELVAKVTDLSTFSSTVINEWKSKTEEILAIQKEWKNIGTVPRSEAKEISKEFWSKGKAFFNGKSSFFKTLDQKREQSLVAKEDLCLQVEKLADLEDLGEACHQAINIQKEWKTIGPAPKALNDKIYNRFRSACDVLFDRRRSAQDKADQDLFVNLEAKQKLVESIGEVFAEGVSMELLDAYLSKWDEYAEVPNSQRKEINQLAQSKLYELIENDDKVDKGLFKTKVEVALLKGDRNADKVLLKKLSAVKKKVSELEDEISNGENNLLFFRNSKSYEQLKSDFEKKNDISKEIIKSLKLQLKVLSNH